MYEPDKYLKPLNFILSLEQKQPKKFGKQCRYQQGNSKLLQDKQVSENLIKGNCWTFRAGNSVKIVFVAILKWVYYRD